MNFLELCQFVLDEGDQVGANMTTVLVTSESPEIQRNVVRWIQQAYARIQRRGRFWKFHRKNGVLIATDGSQDYVKSSVLRVLADSIQIRLVGETSSTPMTFLTYKQWRDLFNGVELTAGYPRWFTELSQGKFRLTPDPDPNRVFEILADWYIKSHVLENDDDSPIWDEDLHELVAWEALKYFALEYEASETLGKRVTLALPGLWQEMFDRYLPEFEITGEFA